MIKFFYFFLFFFSLLSAKGQSATVDADAFEKGIQQSPAQVLDVRSATEFAGGHLAHALSADWNNPAQFKERVSYLDKDKPVYIYCLVGIRSSAAAEWMKSNGFTAVIELKGGLNAWKKMGKPVEEQSHQQQMTIDEYWSALPKDKTVLVDFGASWCPPCIKMQPVLEELRKDPSLQFELVTIDAGIHTDVMQSLGIEPIPAFIIYKNGKEYWRKNGLISKDELTEKLK